MKKFFLVVFSLFFSSVAHSNLNHDSAGNGYLENVVIENNRKIIISGWVGANKPNTFITQAKVLIGEKKIYKGRIGYLSQRLDVVAATGNERWESSGFNIHLDLPFDTPVGKQKINVELMTGDGEVFSLKNHPRIDYIYIEDNYKNVDYLSLFLLLLSIVTPLLVISLPKMGIFSFQTHPHAFSITLSAIFFSFFCLIAGGWSGSSLSNLFERSILVNSNEIKLIGDAQYYRYDEWQVITPLAISQFYHQPQFPNFSNASGQNMNVIGMTGVPIANVSVIAKPAVWGFFLFDLKRALSWYWWLPYFSCFFAISVFLFLFFKIDWRISSLLSLSVTASPYSVSFSGWPVYAVFFPIIGLISFYSLMRSRNKLNSIVSGAVIAWSAMGFLLILYPAWQISIAYLLLIFSFAYFYSFKDRFFWSRYQIYGLIFAFALFSFLLMDWWGNAGNAVRDVKSSVYPGQRSIENGGYIDPWYWSIGLLGHITLYKSSSWMIPSDAGSFIFIWPAIIFVIVLNFLKNKKIDLISLSLISFVLGATIFQFLGFPAWLSAISKWGTIPAFRLDIALGLAQVIFIAHIFTKEKYLNIYEGISLKIKWVSIAVFLITCLYFTINNFYKMPLAIREWFTPAIFVLVAICFAFLCLNFIFLKKYKFVLYFVFWTVSMSLFFNPISLSPSNISAIDDLALARDEDKILIINNNHWANSLISAGFNVINNTFYQPPLKFWHSLDSKGEFSGIYNRYQHLIVDISDKTTGEEFDIRLPSMDRVRLILNYKNFNFNKIKANKIICDHDAALKLDTNNSLRRLTTGKDWVVFEIVN